MDKEKFPVTVDLTSAPSAAGNCATMGFKGKAMVSSTKTMELGWGALAGGLAIGAEGVAAGLGATAAGLISGAGASVGAGVGSGCLENNFLNAPNII